MMTETWQFGRRECYGRALKACDSCGEIEDLLVSDEAARPGRGWPGCRALQDGMNRSDRIFVQAPQPVGALKTQSC